MRPIDQLWFDTPSIHGCEQVSLHVVGEALSSLLEHPYILDCVVQCSDVHGDCFWSLVKHILNKGLQSAITAKVDEYV